MDYNLIYELYRNIKELKKDLKALKEEYMYYHERSFNEIKHLKERNLVMQKQLELYIGQLTKVELFKPIQVIIKKEDLPKDFLEKLNDNAGVAIKKDY